MSSDLFFQNKKYISAKEAAELTSYSRDYIGQLCRDKKVDSKRIGHTWYVCEESILNYKNTPTDFDFAKNFKGALTPGVGDQTPGESSTNLFPRTDLQCPISRGQTSGTKFVKSTHKILFAKNFHFSKVFASVAAIVIFFLGTISLAQGFANLVPMTSKFAGDVSKISLSQIAKSAQNISDEISAAPENSYNALKDIAVFYSSEFTDGLINFGNKIQNATFAFLNQTKKLAKNPPLYIVQSLTGLAGGETKIVDSGISISGNAIATAHEKTFAFISDSIGGLPFVANYTTSTTKNMTSSVAMAVQEKALTPVDHAGISIYDSVNNFFRTNLYSPLLAFLGKSPNIVVPEKKSAGPMIAKNQGVLTPKSDLSTPGDNVASPLTPGEYKSAGITSAELDLRLQELDNKIAAKFAQLSTGNGGSVQNIYNMIAQSQVGAGVSNGGSASSATVANGLVAGTDISVNSITVTGSATSTFAGGIAISGGCISVNGVCLGSGSGNTTGGLAGQFPYYQNDGSTLYATSSIFITPNGNVGIGTTTPAKKFSVDGDVIVSGNIFTTLFNAISLSATNATTSNFAITNIKSSLLKTNADGTVVAAIAGTDYESSTTVNSLINASTTIAKLYTNNNFTGLQTFNYSSSTIYSSFVTASTTNLLAGTISLNGTDLQTTLNGKQSTISANWPFTLTGSTLGWNGLSTSSAATIGNIPYFTSANTFGNVGTTTPTFNLGLTAGGTWSVLGSAPTLTIATSSLYTGTTGQFPYFSGTNTITATSSLFLATSGNVGIGTAIPGVKLQVVGQSGTGNIGVINITGYDSFGQSLVMQLPSTGYTGNLIALMKAAGGSGQAMGFSTHFTSDAVDRFSIMNHLGVENLSVLDSGNVGIGSTSPTYKLSVEGTSSLGNQAIAGYFTATSTMATSTFAGGLDITKGLQLNSGYIFGAGLSSCNGTTAKLLWNATTGQFECGTDAGSSGLGISSINGLAVGVQKLATSSTNGGWGFLSSVDTHTLNIPTASATNPLGLLSSSDWTTFNNKDSFAFPFIAQSYGMSTTSTLGLLGGFFTPASASSTIAGTFNLPSLSNGALAVYNGLVGSYATTTAGSSLTYSGNAFNLNMANANSWTANQTFAFSSTTYASLTTASTTNLTIGGNTFNTLVGAGLINNSGALGLTNTSLTVNAGTGLSGGGTVALGGTITLSNQLATSSGESAGNLAYWTTTNGVPAKLGSVATTTLTASGALSLDHAISVLGSTPSILTCATANSSTFGCLAAADFSKFNSATTTFGGGLSYSNASNQATLNMANANTWTALQSFNYSSSTIYSSFVTASTTNLLAGTISLGGADLQTTLNSKLGTSLAKGKFLVGDDNGVAQATSTIFISSTGNVGIGTAVPGALVHILSSATKNVNGQEVLRLSGTAAADTIGSGPKILFTHSDNTVTASIRSYTFGASDTGLAFSTGYGALTDKMFINNAGSVGIGSTSPTYKLSVEGTSSLGNQAIAGYFTATSTMATSTFAGGLDITKGLQLNSGYIFGAGLGTCSSVTGKITWNSATGQFGCGTDAGSSGVGITSLGAQYSIAQTNAIQTLATSTSLDANLRLTITSAGDTHTFTPSWFGTLDDSRITSAANWNTAYSSRITSASLPLSFSGNVLSISQANGTTNGYLSAADFSKFNSATTTFGGGLTYTAGTNQATLNLGNANTWTALQSFNYSSSTIYSSFVTASTTNLLAGTISLGGTDLQTTLNGKQSTISASWPITLNGATVGFNGLSTSSAAVTGNIPYFTGANTFGNVATTTPTFNLGLTAGGTWSVLGSAPTLSIATSSLYTGTAGQFPYFSDTNTITATSSLFLATSGNVGIGTASPVTPLDIYRNGSYYNYLNLRNGQMSNNVGLPSVDTVFSVSQETPTYGKAIVTGVYSNGDSYALKLKGVSGATSLTAAPLVLTGAKRNSSSQVNVADTEQLLQVQKNDGTALMTMLGGGNLGIGTTSPSYKLDVMGGIASYGSSFFGGAITATSTLNVSGLATFAYSTTTYGSFTTASTTNFVLNGQTFNNLVGSGLSLNNGVLSATGGAGNVSTSSGEVMGQLSYWTTTNGTPAKLGSVATTTLTASGALSLDHAISVLGGTPAILTCTTANATTFGCLAAADFSRFNSATTTFSGGLSYTAGTNQASLNMANANTWTVNQSFNYSSSTIYSSFVTASTTNLLAGTISLNGTDLQTTLNSKLGTTLAKGKFIVGDDNGVAQATSTLYISSLGQIGIGDTSPSALLSVGTTTSTNAVGGMYFGKDTTANLYRSGAGWLKTDGNLEVAGGTGLKISSGALNMNGGAISSIRQLVGATTDDGTGVINFSNANLTSAQYINLTQNTSAFTGDGLKFNFAAGSGSFTGNFAEFQNNSVTKFVVKSDGSTGIGSSTPGSLLSIGGNGTGWNFFDNGTTTSYAKGIDLKNGGCFAVNGTCLSSGGLSAAITSLNGLTGAIQTFATTSIAGGWGWSSVGTTHTLNIPTASATNPLGLLSGADFTTFSNKLGNTLAKGNFFVGSDGNVAQATSSIFISSTGSIGIGTQNPSSLLSILGTTGGPSLFNVASTSGNSIFSILNNGSIGIGTSSPLATLDIQNNPTSFQNLLNFSNSSGTSLMNVGWYGDLTQNISSTSAVNIQDGAGNSVFSIDTTQSSSNAGLDITAGGAQSGNLLNVYSSGGDLLSGITSEGGWFSNIGSTNALSLQNGSGLPAFTFDTIGNQLTVGSSTVPTTSLLNVIAVDQSTDLFDIASTSGTTSYLHVTNTGQTGIGTSTINGTSLASTLTVAGDANFPTYPLLTIASSTGTNLLTLGVNGYLGLGSTTPGSLLSVGGDAVGINFSLATTTYSTTGGINLTKGGCFAVNGTCLSGGGISGLTGSTLAKGSFLVGGDNNQSQATSTLYISSLGQIGIGSTTPWGLLSVNANALTSDTPQFVVGSSTATNFIVANNGNVGIGTTSPQATLNVWGTSGTNPFLVSSSTGSGLMVVQQNGNVGIGTTGPNADLDISNANLTQTIRLGYSGTPAGQYAQFQFNKASDNSLNILTNYSGGTNNVITFSPGGTEKVRFQQNGNVGIGTTTVGSRLVVQGSGATSATTALTVQNSAGSVAMSILNNGNVGIGTTSPSQLLTVGNNNQFTVSSVGALVSQTATIGATAVVPVVVSGTGIFGGASPNGTYSYIGKDGFGANEYQFGTWYIWWDNAVPCWIINHSLGTWSSNGFYSSGGSGTPPYGLAWNNGSSGTVTTAAGVASNLTVDGGGSIITGGTLSVNGTGNSYILGNVGIGTTSPQATLNVWGTSGTNPFLVSSSTGSGLMVVQQNGNVGIGTTTPTNKLTITDTANPQLTLSADAGVSQWAFRNAGGNLYFATTTVAGTATTSTSALSIFNNGNVSIGNSATANTLTVGGGSNLASISNTATSTFSHSISLSDGCFAIGNTCIGSSNGSGTVGVGTQGYVPFYNTATDVLQATSTLYIAQSGYVGIGGVTSPTNPLDVRVGGSVASPKLISFDLLGSVERIKTTSTALDLPNFIYLDSSSGDATLSNTANTQSQILLGANTTVEGQGSLYLDTFSGGGGSIFFRPLGTQKMVLTSDGKLGVNTTAPAGNLQVNDGANAFLVNASGQVGIGTTTLTSKLSVEGSVTSSGASAVAGLFASSTLSNSNGSGFQFGNRLINNVIGGTAGTEDGLFVRMIDSSSAANTVRGLEVQAYSGNNTAGVNTGIATYGKTFGLQAYTTALAGGVSQPAAVFAQLDNGGAPTIGNAIRAYSNSLTSATLVSLYHETSAFTGTGLAMNFGNNSGSFSGNFLDLQNAGVSKFRVNSVGQTIIGSAGSFNSSMLDVASSTATSNVDMFRIISDVGGAANVKFRIDSDGDVFTDGGTTIGSPADIAENYPVAEDGLEAGDVVALSTSTRVPLVDSGLQGGPLLGDSATTTISGLVKASRTERNILGIVSTKPGVLLSGNTENAVPVALAGRVPVKVSDENGAIVVGDYLTVSKLHPGYAAKALYSGTVIGQALESTPGVNGEATLSPGVSSNPNPATSTILAFVHVGWQNVDNQFVLGDNGDQLTGDVGDGAPKDAADGGFLINQKGSGSILQLQSNDQNRFMVATSGAVTILADTSCDVGGELSPGVNGAATLSPGVSSNSCANLFTVKNNSNEIFSVNVRGDVAIKGVLVATDDSFAGSIATKADGTADIDFSYNLGTGKPVVELTPESDSPVFAQVMSWKKDSDGNYTGLVVKTFGLSGTAISSTVHYVVVGKKSGYSTNGTVMNVMSSPGVGGAGAGGVSSGSEADGGDSSGVPSVSSNPASTTPDTSATTTPATGELSPGGAGGVSSGADSQSDTGGDSSGAPVSTPTTPDTQPTASASVDIPASVPASVDTNQTQ